MTATSTRTRKRTKVAQSSQNPQIDVSTDSMFCRDMRHRWEPSGDLVLLEQKGQVKEFLRSLTCDRCGTRRIDQYRLTSYTIIRIKSSYDYAVGYLSKNKLTQADIRWALFRQAEMVPFEPDETS